MSPHSFQRHGVIFKIIRQILTCYIIAVAAIAILYICQVRDTAYAGPVAHLIIILLYYFRIREKQSFEPIGHLSWKSFLIIYGFSVIYIGVLALACLPAQVLTPLAYVAYASLIRFIFTGWAEELIFREFFIGKMLQHGYKPWAAILVSSLVFMLIHFPDQWIAAIPYSILGLALGWYYVKTKDLGIPIALHTCWDAMAWLILRNELLTTTDIENTAPVITKLFPQGLPYEYFIICFVFGWLIFIISIFLIAKKIGGRYVASA